MRNRNNTIFIFALFSLCCSYSNAKTLIIVSHADTLLKDIPCKVSRLSFKKNKSNLVPLLIDTQGKIIPTQLDDIDGDKQWDELSFLINLEKKERKVLQIKWINKIDYPTFEPRTNVHYGKTVADGKVISLNSDTHYKDLSKSFACPYQMDGIAWENDKIGYRHYYDGRNCRDVFGKRTSKMVLEKVGILPDGNAGDTYHVMAEWGRDVLSVGESFGIGGLALLKNDSLIRLGVTASKITDNIDSTKLTILSKGPVRAMFKLDFWGWDIGDQKIDISQIITIWGGSYAYENKIINAKIPAGSTLITGIVDSNNNKPYTERKLFGQSIMYTHDKQTYNKEFYLGLGLIVPQQHFLRSFHAPKSIGGINTTWCAALLPDANNEILYYPLAAWEMEDARFKNRDYFEHVISYEALKYSNPISISIK